MGDTHTEWREYRTWNHLARRGGRLARPGPPHRKVVSTVPFLLQRLHIIALICVQMDGGGLLARKLIPLTRVRPVWDRGDFHLVNKVIVGRKPQLALVIARNPECVAAGHRCRDIPAQTRAVVISPVGWRFEARQRVSGIRRPRPYRDQRDVGAADPCPYLTADGSRGTLTLNGESTEPGITSLGAEVDWPGLAHPTARLSPPSPSFCNAST